MAHKMVYNYIPFYKDSQQVDLQKLQKILLHLRLESKLNLESIQPGLLVEAY